MHYYFIKFIVHFKILGAILLRKPFKLTLELSENCNLHCRNCNIWKNTQETFLDYETIKNQIDNFPGKLAWINITGGEPFLNPQIQEILKYCLKQKHILVTLTTNGQEGEKISQTVLHALPKNVTSIFYLSISLDGFEETHDFLRGTKGAFKEATQTLELFQSKVIPFHNLIQVGVNATLFQENLSEFISFFNWAQNKFKIINVNIAQTSSYYHHQPSGFTLPYLNFDRVELLNVLNHIKNNYPLDADSFIKKNYLAELINFLNGKKARFIPCASLSSYLFLKANGKIIDCTLRFQEIEVKEEKCFWSQARQKRLSDIKKEACCEKCFSPCEKYVHLIKASLSPSNFLIFIWRFLK